MTRYTYQPMDKAPKDRPIIAVCGGVEMAMIWEPEPLGCWCYWDDEGGTDGIVIGEIRGWRVMF